MAVTILANALVLRKDLTPNDLGRTGSHQAGLHVPKAFAHVFPTLREDELNPSSILNVEFRDCKFAWRYIHYNSKVFGSGTRDEYRLTRVTPFLRMSGARVGDTLELRGGDVWRAVLVHDEQPPTALVLSKAGPWRLVRLTK
jgi:hypothetical protein